MIADPTLTSVKYHHFLTAWLQMLKNKDEALLNSLVSPSVRFSSPAVFKTYSNKQDVMHILMNIIEVLPSIKYSHAYDGEEGNFVLRFTAETEVGGKKIHVEGVDIFRLNDSQQVEELTVMFRPYRGLEAVMMNMGNRFVAGMSAREKLLYFVRKKLKFVGV